MPCKKYILGVNFSKGKIVYFADCPAFCSEKALHQQTANSVDICGSVFSQNFPSKFGNWQRKKLQLLRNLTLGQAKSFLGKTTAT